VQLNPDHKIFVGHFPNQPITPGVCEVQMIKEILETAMGNYFQLKTAEHIKFLSVIIPDYTSIIKAVIQYTKAENEFFITASLAKEDKICLKMKGVFMKVE
jgi:3-hydroxyacyl-[acyl-carrier-protein] dehydratase